MYTLMDAVNYLKWQIEKEEQRLRTVTNPAKHGWLEGTIEWQFERALELVRLAKPGEIQQEALDFFLGRIKERPDLVRLREALGKKHPESRLQRIWSRIKGL